MSSEKWLYRTNKTDSCRYLLGEHGTKILGCIGVNPSTARPGALDNTLKSVKRIAAYNGYDGWVMFNLYPQRATFPSQLHLECNLSEHRKNSLIIHQTIKLLHIRTIWLAYGDLIGYREYLPMCLKDIHLQINELKPRWKIVADLTKKGNPRHPLYQKSESRLLQFNFTGSQETSNQKVG